MHLFIAHAGWRVERVAPGETAHAWSGALRGFDPESIRARVLKEDDGVGVYSAPLLGRAVVLKRWDMPRMSDRLKAILRSGRADRHWRNAAFLERAGIGTARCLALATEYRRGGPRRWLVMEALPGKTVLEHAADPQMAPRDQHALAAALGEQVAYLEACGRGNRDHKPSNLIVSRGPEGPEISIIDCVAIKRGVKAERMLASLVIESLGCGVLPRRALLMRAVVAFAMETLMYPNPRLWTGGTLRERRNETWQRVASLVREHGDPRPRIDPLAPRTRALESD